MVDFSKAFDTVDHIVLVQKLQSLGLPSSIFNWIVSFLTGRTQYCKIDGVLSFASEIDLSIIQGSGIGPSLYNVMESDLKPKSSDNILIKFADDTNLLVPERTDCDLVQEFEHIKNWADRNKMHINMAKTKELVFYRSRPVQFEMPVPLDYVAQVKVAKLLGVMFTGKLSFEEHINFILSVCTQRVYLLKLLRSQGLPCHQLHLVFLALILSRITYSLSAWGGFLTSSQSQRIDAFLRRSKKFGFTGETHTIQALRETADCKLFELMQQPHHCLNHLLPVANKSHTFDLRARGHPYSLPICNFDLSKKSFVCRCLFNYV